VCPNKEALTRLTFVWHWSDQHTDCSSVNWSEVICCKSNSKVLKTTAARHI